MLVAYLYEYFIFISYEIFSALVFDLHFGKDISAIKIQLDIGWDNFWSNYRFTYSNRNLIIKEVGSI